MRRLSVYLLIFLLINCPTFADTVDVPVSRPAPIRQFLTQYLQTSSFQLSLFSYKPKLGSLLDVLRSVGVEQIPSKPLPMFSVVFKHALQLDSRFELGYWKMQLDIPPPTSLDFSATFIPVSYQLIYRPILLSEFVPIYLGGGIGFLGTSLSGSALDLIEEQGISFDNSSPGPTGYVFVGAEIFQSGGFSLNLELKRILKTIESTGTIPLDLILDGTAIGLTAEMQF